MKVCVAFVMVLAAFASDAAAQGRPEFLVQGAAGTNLNGGGYSRAASIGIKPMRYLEFLISAERNHIPTEVKTYDNGFSVSRGGTTSFISAEGRVPFLPDRRVTPYALVGVGRGKGRPNVNEHFPDEHNYDAGLLFAGGGVRARIAGPLEVFGELRFVLQVDTSESGVYGFTPVRGGIALRF